MTFSFAPTPRQNYSSWEKVYFTCWIWLDIIRQSGCRTEKQCCPTPMDEYAKPIVNLNFQELPTERKLELMWDVRTDGFKFSCTLTWPSGYQARYIVMHVIIIWPLGICKSDSSSCKTNITGIVSQKVRLDLISRQWQRPIMETVVR